MRSPRREDREEKRRLESAFRILTESNKGNRRSQGGRRKTREGQIHSAKPLPAGRGGTFSTLIAFWEM